MPTAADATDEQGQCADAEAREEAAAAAAPAPAPPVAKASLLLRVAPVVLSPGVVLAHTPDPLLRALLLEQPQLMDGLQGLLEQAATFAHTRYELAAAAGGGRQQQRQLDLRQPTSDLICWDTLATLTRAAPSAAGGAGRRRVPSLIGADGSDSEDEAAQAADDEEQAELASALELARQVRGWGACVLFSRQSPAADAWWCAER